MVISGLGTTVVGHQGEQQQTQDAALRGAGAPSDDIGGIVAHPHRLRSVGEEVKQTVTQGGVEAVA